MGHQFPGADPMRGFVARSVAVVAALTSLSPLFYATSSLGKTTWDPEVSTLGIVTTSHGGAPECDGQTIDRRGAAALRPQHAERGLSADGVFLVESKIGDNFTATPYHRAVEGNIGWNVGHHVFGVGVGKDESDQVLWGCASSVATRLRREQRIQEDLLVAGDRVTALNGMGKYEFGSASDKVGLVMTSRREQGEYARFQQDLLLSATHQGAGDFAWTLQGGGGDEGVRDERYRNLRALGSIAYRPLRDLGLAINGNIQRRGDNQRVSEGGFQVTKQILRGLSTRVQARRVVSERGPRFTTNAADMALEADVWGGSMNATLGRSEVDAPRNANNILSGSYEKNFLRWNKIRLRASQGTEFVAIVRTARVLEAGYFFAMGSGTIASQTDNMSLGANYAWTRLWRSPGEVSDTRITELTMRWKF